MVVMRMCVVMLMASPPAVLAVEQIAGSLTLTAHVRSRRLLTVSTDLLQFEVGDLGREAVAEVEFTAAVRTRSGAEVLLSVECVGHVERQGGPTAGHTELRFSGEGEGTLAGTLCAASPAIAARWHGSGRRVGRWRFALRAGVPGTYTVPVRFTLSAP
jgi:hypothetical protein